MKRKILPYNPNLKERAKALRNNMTLSEILLWQKLKRGQLKEYDFDRQRPIDNYIVDFYCKELMLAIEVDGYSHESEEAYLRDQKRQHRIEHFGVSFLRFEDQEVKNDIDSVLTQIMHLHNRLSSTILITNSFHKKNETPTWL